MVRLSDPFIGLCLLPFALSLACGGDVSPASESGGSPDSGSPDATVGGGGADSPAVAGAGGKGGAGGMRGSSGQGGGSGQSGQGSQAGQGGVSGKGGAGGSSGAGGSPGASDAMTIWLAGDSTVANGQTPCPVGWGKRFAELFDARVKVVNGAAGGRSVRTWLYDVMTTKDDSGECELTRDGSGEPVLQARWQTMLDGMKEGDYLLIQFGINDASSTCDRHVGVDAFRESFGYMAEAATERGAHPVFITPVSSISCNGETPRATRSPYDQATLDAGMEHGVPVLDLESASVALYAQLDFCPVAGGDVSASTTGPVGDFFCDDHTHFSATGAPEIGRLVAAAIEDAGLPLAAYLK